MNLTTISYTNQKGQLVIPAVMRKNLDIDDKTPLLISLTKTSIHIRPVRGFVFDKDEKKSDG